MRFVCQFRCLGALVCALLVLLPWLSVSADAQSRRPIFVRDAETEDLLRDYVRPIFRAAGLPVIEPEVILIQDRSFNAFVADGKRIFIHTGVLIDAEDPTEVIGVLAHETGHIAGGHLAGLHDAVARARTIGAIATLLGAAAVGAGAAAGSPDAAQGGFVIAGGGQDVALRSLLAYRRAQETAADRAAITYLDRVGISARGMVQTFRRFQSEQIFSSRFSDPYLLSHPIARDRIASTERLARMSRYWDAPLDPKLVERHNRVRAKLLAFTTHPRTTAREYPRTDRSVSARYARAIATSRTGSPDRAVRQMDDLLKSEPNNPYFWEFRGQILLEAGRPKEALNSLSKAVSLEPTSGLLNILYGRALVATNDQSLLRRAVEQLELGLMREPSDGLGWRQLAIAESRLGNDALANLATANGLMIGGDLAASKGYARRAQRGLPTGSPAWLRAEDIIRYQPPDFQRRRR